MFVVEVNIQPSHFLLWIYTILSHICNNSLRALKKAQCVFMLLVIEHAAKIYYIFFNLSRIFVVKNISITIDPGHRHVEGVSPFA